MLRNLVSRVQSLQNTMSRLYVVSLVAILFACGGGGGGEDTGKNKTKTPVIRLLAGSAGGQGNANGLAQYASFNYPWSTAVDKDGNVYVADSANHTIRKISTDGMVSTFAGTLGSAGSDNGTGAAAKFSSPAGIAVDALGNVYVTEASHHWIRKITKEGLVSTWAGDQAMSGADDGRLNLARFWVPIGLTVDATGNVYVADTGNRTIRKITPDGEVTTIAGLARYVGNADGNGTSARFNSPVAVAVDNRGNLYVADKGNHLIRKINTNGDVATLAGSGDYGLVNATGTSAKFNSPNAVAVDSNGNVFVADSNNHLIRKITAAGVVTTLAGADIQAGFANGTGVAAKFSYPLGLSLDKDGNLYVGDNSNHVIRKISQSAVVTNYAGSAFSAGNENGTGTQAKFNAPKGLAVDSFGNVFVSDSYNHQIRKISIDGVVSHVAGSTTGEQGALNGIGTAAKFNIPQGMSVASDASLYVADTSNHQIRKISSAGVVTTLAGAADSSTGYDNGTGTAAKFKEPLSLSVDTNGNAYVADYDNHLIRKISKEGVVTTLAGSAGVSGSVDATGTAAKFSYPTAVAVDNDGNVYVADYGNQLIRKITPSGLVSTFAGTAGSQGSTNGSGASARFSYPYGLAIDKTGNLYVAEQGQNLIRKITPQGIVSTLAGTAGVTGFKPGELPGYLTNLNAIVVGNNNLYFTTANGVGVIENLPP